MTHAYALGLLELGCQPVVVTCTPAPDAYDNQFPYPVRRQVGFREFRRVLHDVDCIVLVHQSLVYILWSLFVSKPVISSIHGGIWNWNTPLNAVFCLLVELHLRFRPHVVLISDSVRSPATRHAPIIGNPYDAEVFRDPFVQPPSGTIIFSGRLTRAKGVFHLVAAGKILRERGVDPRLTFVGAGPDETELRQAIAAAGLGDYTRFVAHCEPERVAELLGKHQIAAIPSDWNEPFGLVALEAIACGCYVVAFPDGGLPFAIGEAGLVTSEKSPEALADGIQRVLTDDATRNRIDEKRAAHLEKFSRRNVVTRLLDMIKVASRQNGSISK